MCPPRCKDSVWDLTAAASGYSGGSRRIAKEDTRSFGGGRKTSKAGSRGGMTALSQMPTMISSSWSHSFHELTTPVSVPSLKNEFVMVVCLASTASAGPQPDGPEPRRPPHHQHPHKPNQTTWRSKHPFMPSVRRGKRTPPILGNQPFCGQPETWKR